MKKNWCLVSLGEHDSLRSSARPVCVCVCVCVCVYACKMYYVCVHACMYVYIRMYVCIIRMYT